MYQATLHRGERVQTAQEVRAEKRNGGGVLGGGITVNMHGTVIREDADVDKIADKLARELIKAFEGGAA